MKTSMPTSTTITCFIKYKINPYKLAEFEHYARNWGEIIPACGGALLGYFLPDEGTNFEAYGLISFPSLSAYENYRTRLKQDPAGKENFAFAQHSECILEETRTFLRPVENTYQPTAEVANDSRTV